MLNKKLSILHRLKDYIVRSVSKDQLEGKLDGIPHSIQTKAKLCIVVLEDHGNNVVQEKGQQCKWSWWNGFYVVGYHSIMKKQAYLANGKWDMSWWFWIGLNNGLLCMNKKSLILD